jgi:hypothetical protein
MAEGDAGVVVYSGMHEVQADVVEGVAAVSGARWEDALRHSLLIEVAYAVSEPRQNVADCGAARLT